MSPGSHLMTESKIGYCQTKSLYSGRFSVKIRTDQKCVRICRHSVDEKLVLFLGKVKNDVAEIKR